MGANDFNYPVSKDYARLFELAKRQRVICILEDKRGIRDIARTRYHHDASNGDCIVEIGIRGIVYVQGCSVDGVSGKEMFVAGCEERNVGFIEPEKEVIIDDKTSQIVCNVFLAKNLAQEIGWISLTPQLSFC